jgi:hypothetical protein
VHLLDEAIEDTNIVAAAKKFFRNGSADETRTASNKYSFPQERLL